MKKIIFFSITLLILMCSEYAISDEGNPYCMDYFDVDCVPGGLYLFTPCNTNPGSPYCEILVHYCTRTVHDGDNVYRDVYIKDYSLSDECDCFSQSDIISIILKSIWDIRGPEP